MQNILVTGGAGFVGSNLIETLSRQYPESRIISIDNYIMGTKENHHPDLAEYAFCSTKDIDNFMDFYYPGFEPDVVFHLGEYSRIVSSFPDIKKCHDSNFTGTFAVLEYCLKHNSKLVYAASSSKFGNDGEDQHLSPYAWMKSKNVELINNYKNWFGLESAVTYFYNVYGNRQISTGSYATIIGIFQDQYLNGKPLSIVEPGTQKRDFTNVEDIVDGIILAAEKGSGDDYLLGTGTNYTIIEVAEMFEHPYVFIPARTGERFTSQAYPSKAQSELGWSAKINLPDYVKDWKSTLHTGK